MPSKIVRKSEMNSLLRKLSRSYLVFGPVKKDGEFVFDEIRSAEDLELGYITTRLPPKKYLFPLVETFFSYEKDVITDNKHGNADRKQLIFGIHPCDVNAILLLDKYFLGDYKDPYYLRRRENTVIAALTCGEIGDNCFCESFGTGPSLKEGYDLLLTDVGDRYLVEVGSKIGEQIVQEAHLSDATTEDFREKEERLKAARAKFKKKVNTDNLAEVMLESLRHNIWTELKDTCLSVGSCSLVCPTCFCFSVHDTVDLTLEKGERWREWDSCQLLEYAEVALGGNFRKDRGARVRHWMNCKLCYVKLRHGMFGCVGCGRCIKDCPAGIDIAEVARMIRGE